MKKVLIYFFACLPIAGIFCWSACFKKDFDSPPDDRNYDPDLMVTTTIAALKELPQYAAITQDIVIKGVVIMDDRSGNFFRKIVIRDSSGGIGISIDQNNLYNDYPVGRKLYVKCKGLFLGNRHQTMELGYTPDANGDLAPIPFPILDQFIIKANYPNTYPVDTLTISDLSAPNAARQYLNTLIALKDVEFARGSAGVPYAQTADISTTTNLSVEDCTGATITLVNSDYARFQPFLTPKGKGLLTALYTRFDNAPQLYIRDTTDISFHQIRCSGSTVEPPALIRIDSLRKLNTGTAFTLPALSISGIVISDAADGNVAGGTVVLQGGNADRGIVLAYDAQADYDLGDSLIVNITGCVLNTIDGKLEVEGVREDKTVKAGVQKNIVPKAVTIAEVLTHKDQYESTLVRLSNVSFQTGMANYYGNNGSISLSDGTGTITHYCSGAASFKNLSLPVSPVTAVTGYIEIHGLYGQIRIRYPNAPINDVVP